MSRHLYISLLLMTTFLMGSSFAIIKIAFIHQYASPLFLAALRFISAGIFMAIIIFLLKVPHPSKLKTWFQIALIGTFQTAGVMAAIFLSLRTITASESAILTFTNPLLVVIFGTFFVGMYYRPIQWIGVILGLIGVVITLGLKLNWEIGTIIGLCGAISWSISTLLVNQWRSEFNTWVLSAYQMLFGGILLLIGSFIHETPFFIINLPSLVILIWLSIVSSVIQFAAWYYLLQNSDPGKTSSFLFLAPFFGVISGWILLNDPLKPSLLLGGIFILIGIYLVNRKK